MQIIAILLASMLLLLTVPVTVAFTFDHIKELKGQLIFCWLFGLVRFRISLPKGAKAAQQHKRTSRVKKIGKGDARSRMRDILALLRQTPFRRRIIRFVGALFRAMNARRFYLRLRIGLSDPADTGRLWGFLGPVAGIAANFHRAEVRIEPEFTTPMLEAKGHGEFRLIPLQFIGLATAFIVSPAILHAWFSLRRSSS